MRFALRTVFSIAVPRIIDTEGSTYGNLHEAYDTTQLMEPNGQQWRATWTNQVILVQPRTTRTYHHRINPKVKIALFRK